MGHMLSMPRAVLREVWKLVHHPQTVDHAKSYNSDPLYKQGNLRFPVLKYRHFPYQYFSTSEISQQWKKHMNNNKKLTYYKAIFPGPPYYVKIQHWLLWVFFFFWLTVTQNYLLCAENQGPAAPGPLPSLTHTPGSQTKPCATCACFLLGLPA